MTCISESCAKRGLLSNWAYLCPDSLRSPEVWGVLWPQERKCPAVWWLFHLSRSAPLHAEWVCRGYTLVPSLPRWMAFLQIQLNTDLYKTHGHMCRHIHTDISINTHIYIYIHSLITKTARKCKHALRHLCYTNMKVWLLFPARTSYSSQERLYHTGVMWRKQCNNAETKTQYRRGYLRRV